MQDAPGRGAKPSISNDKKARLITQATQPPPNRSRWSVRTMAREIGVAPSSVHRIWAANDLKPHLTRTFKLSSDPAFEAKFWDVIGLYLSPPTRALVLCCDEKSQCQALERTQRGLPLGPGYVQTVTHDYVRHGTVTLFAALNYLDGRIISTTAAQHTHVEWLAFLKKLHRQTPKDLDLHLIVDNYATHKHPVVRDWLTQHPRMHVHFTPTGSSWLNLVERFFRQLTDNVVRSGSFESVDQLVRAINVHLAYHNLKPVPYRWRAEGAAILEKIHRARIKQTH
jgi:transposase